MAGVLTWILTFSVLGSVASLIGGIFLLWKEEFAKKISLGLVSFAAGVLISAAFLGLLPEAIEHVGIQSSMIFVLVGISLFYVIERLLIWHHCHKMDLCEVHLPSYMILIGDAVHNFIDGIIITAAFLINIPLGIITSIGVIAHEIPQEIGDFGVMLHGGWEKKKVLIYNLLAATTTIFGAVIAYFALPFVEGVEPFLLAFAAGNFIYLSTGDLIPETNKERTIKKSMVYLMLFFLGMFVLWYVSSIVGHTHG